MITTWKQRERRDGIVLKQISLPGARRRRTDDLVDRFARGDHPEDAGHPRLPHHEPDRARSSR